MDTANAIIKLVASVIGLVAALLRFVALGTGRRTSG